MALRLEEDHPSIVLIGGFDPRRFQPHWFRSEKLLGEAEAEHAEIKMVLPQVVDWSTDWFDLQVMENRFAVTAKVESRAESLRDFAIGTFQLLEHTVTSALGMNRTMHFDVGGEENLALGNSAGYNVTGSFNIDIGSAGTSSDNHVIRIGTPGTQTAAYIAGISTTRLTGAAVYVDSQGQLGVLASSERYKTAITTMSDNSAKLDALRPVTFHLKNEPRGALQYGLIAEEVDKVYPELVIRDETGKIQGVRYDELAPILLRETQQQRQEMQQQRQALQTERAERKRDQEAIATQLAAVLKQNEALQTALLKLQAPSERLAMR